MSIPLTQLWHDLGDRYQPVRELGRGGMASVWLVRDLKHDREVAIKVLDLPVGVSLGPERFLREIRLTAQLQHPHILPVFDSGNSAGLLWYTMPFVQGESLRTRLQRQHQFPVDEVIQIGQEVARALDYAHGHGIVHRDVKPENILMSSGHALLADLGIARGATPDRLTETGLALGTPGYMSPEQMEANWELDARSDVYSLGCVLYELLAGEQPYSGPTAQVVFAKHLGAAIPSVRTVRPDVPEDLDRAIQRAMAKSPAGRFSSARDMAGALAVCHSSGNRDTRRLMTGIAALVVLAGTLWGIFQSRHSPPSPTGRRSVAVLPFENLSSDPETEYFSDGMTEDITSHLGRLGDLKVIAHTSASQYRGRHDPPSAIGQALGVATLLQGSVRREGRRVRVAARLVDAGTGEQIWTDEYDRELRDVFAIQRDIAERIAAALRITLSSEQRARLGRVPTANAEAYNLYLLGRHYFEQGNFAGFRRSIEYFDRAIATDSGFALAYVGLADAKSFLGRFGLSRPRDVFPEARAAARRALQLDSTLSEAHASFGLISAAYDWNWTVAETEFRRALALNPNSAYARMWYAFFVLLPQQRYDEAIAGLQEALNLDPVSLQLRYQLGMANYFAGRHDSAIAEFRRTLDLDHNYSPAQAGLGFAYAAAGRYALAIAATQAAVADSAVTSDAVLGYVYALAGRRPEANAILQRLQERARHQYVVSADFKLLYIGLGQVDSALSWLRRAFDEREPLLLWDAADRNSRLRGDPRFAATLRSMGLGGTGASRDSVP